MREQLISYVDLLFAGAEDADDIKQEILQNTLDRYDDLINQGKSPPGCLQSCHLRHRRYQRNPGAQ